jgi:hypothetical protein
MSDLAYISIQFLVLLAYGCWVSYRAGFGHGQQSREKELRGIE